MEIVNTIPHHAPSTGSDVVVPLAQALISAGIGALVVGVLALVAGRADTLRLVGVAFVGILALAWAWRLGIVTSLLQTVERITQEIDGDEDGDEDPGHAMTINAGAARADAARKERSSERALRLADLLAFAQRCRDRRLCGALAGHPGRHTTAGSIPRKARSAHNARHRAVEESGES